MWYEPPKYIKSIEDVNARLMALKGELSDHDAKVSLVEFLKANLGFTVELLTGIVLAPYQEITLKGWFNRNFSLCVWGRGCSKSFLAAIFCFLCCIFEPDTKILIAGPTFRTARNIFTELEKIVKSKNAKLLAACFTDLPSRRNDLFEWTINGGSIKAIPLNGEKIRGIRANVLIVDEFLLMTEEIVDTVLTPFLVAPSDITERFKKREEEDRRIKEGLMKESERQEFGDTSRMICLSSASYTFEFLYKRYKDWMNIIYSDRAKDEIASYFISQIGYEVLPTEMVQKTVIEQAKAGGTSSASFLREYCAQFTDDSEGFYSAKKMKVCTIPDGEKPHLLLTGIRDRKYIVSIDPSFSNSPSSDFFAFCVCELNEETKQPIVVHNYAVAGGDLKDHIKYFFYIMTSFNVVMIIADNAGGRQFLDACVESELFKNGKVKLELLEFDSCKENMEYFEELTKLKRTYNREAGKIAFEQVFTSEFIRRANEYLQSCIDHKKVWFASRIRADAPTFETVKESKVNCELVNEENIGAFIDTQDELIEQVKKQCALIELKSTAMGHQSFDLPQHLRRSTSEDRARKDNYTTLLLAVWAARVWFDMRGHNDTPPSTFAPILI